jgi:hypothetical protein
MKKRDAKDEGMITTTVAFDRAIYRELGHRAVDEDTTVRELIRRAVAEYIRRHQKGDKS